MTTPSRLAFLCTCAFYVVLPSLSVGEPGHTRVEPARRGQAEGQDPRKQAREAAVSQLDLTQEEKLLIEQPDRTRPKHPIIFPVLGRPLSIGGRYAVLTGYEGSKLVDFDFFDLDSQDLDGDGNKTEIEDAARGDTPRDDQLRVNQGLQADLFYPFTPQLSVYGELKLFSRNLAWSENQSSSQDWLLERGEFWLYLGSLLDSSMGLQVGRQRYFDEREWWWDEDLDSLRLRLDLPRFHAQLAVAQDLLPVDLTENHIDPEDEQVLQILGMARWRWASRQEIGVYALHRRDHSSHQPLIEVDPLRCVPLAEIPPNLPEEAQEFFRSGCPDPVGFEDDSDADLSWLGASADGRWKTKGWGRLQYWLQVAGVWGKERFNGYSGPAEDRLLATVDTHRVSGWGMDAGATWKLGGWGRPYLTFGYAFGSGDTDMRESRDTGFRQTGLQDNSDRLGGVVSFRYYGMLLDPELSNLHLVTAGIGFRFLEKSSIDFIYHWYRQAEAAPFLRDVGFKRDPDGVHPEIGQEWDLILGIEDWEPVEFRLIGSIFRPGQAFDPEIGELSYLVSLRVRVNF